MGSIEEFKEASDSIRHDILLVGDWVYPHPTDFRISEHPIDEVKPLKVCSTISLPPT